MVEMSYANVERSTRITIKVTDVKGNLVEVGSIKEINPSERRAVTAHFTFGGTNPEEPKVLIPGLVTDKTISVSNIALWNQNVLTAFANNNGDVIATLVDQKEPFLIEVVKENADKSSAVTRRYEDCLFSDYSYTQSLNNSDVTIIESATIVYRRLV